MNIPAKLKFLACVLPLMLLAVLAETGCSKKLNIDTVNLDYSFQSGTNQPVVTEAIQAIDQKDYATALAKLQKVAADPQLTADQKKAVEGVIQQLQQH